jgi:hypothetical protein
MRVEGDEQMTRTIDYEVDKTMGELDCVLKKKETKIMKAPGIDNLGVELFKYGNALLKYELLQLFNNVWHSLEISKYKET